MGAARIDRSTLEYPTSYRGSHVIVNAVFDASMASAERGHYRAVVFVHPKTKALLLDMPWSVQVWKEGRYWAAHPPNMDRSFDFLEELSRVVVSSPGWKKHMQLGPDPKLVILRDGTELREGTPAYENYRKSYLWSGPAPR